MSQGWLLPCYSEPSEDGGSLNAIPPQPASPPDRRGKKKARHWQGQSAMVASPRSTVLCWVQEWRGLPPAHGWWGADIQAEIFQLSPSQWLVFYRCNWTSPITLSKDTASAETLCMDASPEYSHRERGGRGRKREGMGEQMTDFLKVGDGDEI